MSAARESEGARGDLRWLAVALGLVALGVALRLANAWNYLLLFGYDATHSWDYVGLLRESWALPSHDAAWSTHRPPLFYYASALLARAFDAEALRGPVVASRVVGAALGGFAAYGAWDLVRRDGGSRRRGAIAVGLVLLLPANLVMSSMFNEEIWVAGFTSIAIWALARHLQGAPGERAISWVVLAGIAGGLASLTKLTGLLAPATCAAGLLAIAGGAQARGEGAAARVAVRDAFVVGLVAAAVGAWFYLRHWFSTGALWPSDLSGHSLMHTMPPGSREWLDYLRLPLATFDAPLATHPDLLRSVWGTVYADLWFDAHRHFVPRGGAWIGEVSRVLLALALLPSVAFAVGALRSARRLAGSRPVDAEVPLLVLIGLTLVGFVAYSIANPWFASTKGHYLIGLSLPFAFFASRELDRWSDAPRIGVLVLVALGLLAVVCAVAFSFETPLWDWGPRPKGPGLPWRSATGELLGVPGG